MIDQTAEEKKRDDIASIAANLARFLGYRNPKKLSFVLSIDDLVITVNDTDGYTIIMHNGRPVYGNAIPCDIIYEPGPWMQIITNLRDQIRMSQTAAEIRAVSGGYEIGPLVEVGA